MTSRPIERGDWVIVHTGTISKEYTIVDITPSKDIHIQTPEGISIVRYINGKWGISGFNQDHWLEFTKARSGLSDLEEMNMEIMVNLPLNDIETMCRTSPLFHEICKKNSFWRMKFIREYGKEPTNVTSWEKLYKNYGDVYVLGAIGNWKPGDQEHTGIVHRKPTLVEGVKGIACACGMGSAFIIDENHDVWAFGYNNKGQLGIGNKKSTMVPVRINHFKAKSIYVGRGFTMFLDLDGKLYVTGAPNTEVTTTQPTPVESVINMRFKEVVGRSSIWLIDSDNNGWVFFSTGEQLKRNFDLTNPQPLQGLKIKKVATNMTGTMFIDMDNNVWVYGENSQGQLGVPPSAKVYPPQMLEGIKAKKIALGSSMSGIIDMDDNLWLSGYKGNEREGRTVLPNGRVKYPKKDPAPEIITGIKVKDISLADVRYVLDTENRVWNIKPSTKLQPKDNMVVKSMTIGPLTEMFIV